MMEQAQPKEAHHLQVNPTESPGLPLREGAWKWNGKEETQTDRQTECRGTLVTLTVTTLNEKSVKL